MIKSFIIFSILILRESHAPTPSPTESPTSANWMSALIAGGGSAALPLLATISLALGAIIFMTRRQKVRDLTIFASLWLAIASLVLLAAIVLFMALLVLGFPSFPSPSELTLAQLGGVAKIGLSVAAAVGVVVTLLVTYRKQRDSEAVREADLFRTAVEQLGSDQYFLRLTGVLALRDLADRWEPWRQRCIDMLCVALVQPGEGAEGINRAIYEILRERFNERSLGWRGCSILIAHGEIPDLDLSNLFLHHGTLTLRGITVSRAANLSSIKLTGNSRIILDGIRVNSTLSLRGIHCQRDADIEINKMLIDENGVLDLKKLQIARGGKVLVQELYVSNGGRFVANNLRVNGLLKLSAFTCEPGATIDLRELACTAGRVSINNVEAAGCSFMIDGANIHNGGYLRIHQYDGPDGWLSLGGGRVTSASVVSLTNIFVYDGACLNLSGLYNKSGSLFRVHAVVNAGLVDFAGFENEDEGSVFILEAHLEGGSGRVQFKGGGNYRGDTHIEAYNTGRSNPAGTLSFEDVSLWRGQIEVNLRPAVNVLAKELSLKESEITVHANADSNRKLYRATQPRPTDVKNISSHNWSDHLTKSPLGRPIRAHDGEL